MLSSYSIFALLKPCTQLDSTPPGEDVPDRLTETGLSLQGGLNFLSMTMAWVLLAQTVRVKHVNICS